jgi:hypothetical protein
MVVSVTSSVAYDATVDATAVVQLQQAIADAVQLLHADANCSLRLKWLQALRRFCLCSSGLLQENVKNLVEQKILPTVGAARHQPFFRLLSKHEEINLSHGHSPPPVSMHSNFNFNSNFNLN